MVQFLVLYDYESHHVETVPYDLDIIRFTVTAFATSSFPLFLWLQDTCSCNFFFKTHFKSLKRNYIIKIMGEKIKKSLITTLKSIGIHKQLLYQHYYNHRLLYGTLYSKVCQGTAFSYIKQQEICETKYKISQYIRKAFL